jgi:hypothetical protein
MLQKARNSLRMAELDWDRHFMSGAATAAVLCLGQCSIATLMYFDDEIPFDSAHPEEWEYQVADKALFQYLGFVEDSRKSLADAHRIRMDALLAGRVPERHEVQFCLDCARMVLMRTEQVVDFDRPDVMN